MNNFDPNNAESVAAFILENLPQHKHFALATVDDINRPWVVCLSLAYDEQMTIIWKSMLATEHSRHIAKRPDVSICIFSKNDARGDFGFYATGIARTVTDQTELARVLAIRSRQKGIPEQPLNELLGDAPARLYAATLEKAWINDDRHIKTPVDLGILRRIAAKQ